MNLESNSFQKSQKVSSEDAEKRFNLEEVGQTDELYRAIGDLQNITELNQEQSLIFETSADPDFKNLPDFIKNSFSERLIEEAAISRITIRPDIAHINLGKGLYLSLDQYRDWLSEKSDVVNHKVRAENFTTWVTSGWAKENFDIEKAQLPILIYSFEGDDLEKISHLDSLHKDAKMEMYKLGTVSHEIGHHLFSYLLSDELKNEFTELCNSEPVLTEYAGKYKDRAVYSEEQFCEAVRLMTTNPTYLEETSAGIYRWISQELPDIRTVDRNS